VRYFFKKGIDMEWTPAYIIYSVDDNMKIKEVSKITGMSIDTLRYYEKEGLLDYVQRDENGRRNYGEDDLEKIEFIRCMRRAGIPVGTIAEYMKMCAAGDDTIPDRKQLLLREREAQLEKMKQLQECLNRLDCKIETYEAIISGECRGEDSDSSWTSKEVVKRCHKYEKKHK